MKPRLFIGSSRESITVAYAAQENLKRNTEVTVWDQGVVKLSLSTLESLLASLHTQDFALFVFSPDDLLRIRGEEHKAVRDNVIFELGLFTGLLGRERCFLLVPEGESNLRIPTDLIGMTPAEYEANRSDESLQAATAPACHSIQQLITERGIRQGRLNPHRTGGTPDEAEDGSSSDSASPTREAQSAISDHNAWFTAYIAGDYDRAINMLEEALQKADSLDEQITLDSWLGRAKYDSDPSAGTTHLEAVIGNSPTVALPYLMLAYGHADRDLLDEALAVVDRGISAAGDPSSLIQAKARFLTALGQQADAITLLQAAIAASPQDANFYLQLADVHQDLKELASAKEVLEDALQQLPKNEALLSKYASILYELPNKKLALVPYAQLLELKPENHNYRARRGNILLELGLNGLSMQDYKKATALAHDAEAWILANIGNLLKNVGFNEEAIEYLHRALAIDSDSEFAHERLAHAVKARDEEQQKLNGLLREAKQEIRSQRFARSHSTELGDSPS